MSVAGINLPDHLDLIASAPNGIQKLRGLILELAVRGKLVPQDPKDEPASELLKRIAKERARLEAEGTCKKFKTTPLVSEDEQQFALPPGWEWVRFSSYALEVSTGPFGSMLHQSDYRSGGIPLVNPSHMIGGWVVPESHIAVDEAKANELSSYRLRCGDIVMARRGEVGRTALVTEKEDGWLCGTGSFVIRLAQAVSRTYVVMLFRASSIRRYLGDEAVGTTMVNLNHGILNSMPVALPPLAEQHRIVAKVDELMVLCDRMEAEQTDAEAAHAKLVETLLGALTQSPDAAELAARWQRLAEHFDTLFTTESSLDALEQTILQLAVMGKLVPQDPNDEPASELLKRIAMERARLETEGTCKKSKATPLVSGDELDRLPTGWRWSPLDSLVRVMDSGWSPACIETPSPSDDVWGVLKTTAVQTFRYLEYENKELPTHLEPRPECEVAAGDILITRAGPKNRVAISCLVEATRPRLMISDKIIRFHLVEGGMYEKFVALCLNAGATASYLENAKSGMAASQMNITQEKLRAVPVPICSTSEQHRIVAKVDELMALCDRLKAGIKESRTRQARLSATLIESALQAA